MVKTVVPSEALVSTRAREGLPVVINQRQGEYFGIHQITQVDVTSKLRIQCIYYINCVVAEYRYFSGR